MDELEKTKRNTRQSILAGILWLISTILAGLSFFAGRRMILSTQRRFFPGGSRMVGGSGYSLLDILVSLALACFVIAIVIGGFEFHFRKAGTDESKRLFARTLAVEFGILLLALFL
jgi:hypothetical protein